MKQDYVIPTICNKCGATFDLWYELVEGDKRINKEEIEERLGKKQAESLCWDCKQEFITRFVSRETEEDDSQLEFEDFYLDLDVDYK